jgi:hypothetical protein
LLYNFSGFGNSFASFATKAAVPFESATDGISVDITTYLHAIKSIANQVATFQNVQGTAVTNAAMSDGIFRMDHMMEFIRSQADAQSWKDLGTVCNAFATQMEAITWSGSFVDGTGNQKTWDISSTMQTITDKMTEVCSKASQITP